MYGSDRRSLSFTDERFDFANEGMTWASVWGLVTLRDRIRAGGELRYLGVYDYQPESGGDGVAELGHLVELVGRSEYVLPAATDIDLVLGAQAGLAVLFPGGDFEREIEALKQQGAGVWNVPRLGYLMGPQVGGRYRLSRRTTLRADLAVLWWQAFLFYENDAVAGVRFEKSRRANIVRLQLGVSLEVAL